MNMSPIETDYLVIGAGAIGMAFVDTLLTDTDARVVMADRHHRPGGHRAVRHLCRQALCVVSRRCDGQRSDARAVCASCR